MSSSINRPGLSSRLQQALNMLDLNPEKELARYQQHKHGSADELKTFESAELIEPSPSSLPPLTVSFASAGVMTMDEEDEDYEIIPPSEPFAVYEEVSGQVAAMKSDQFQNQARAGEIVLTGQLPENESLNLSLVPPPGEIASVRDEYLPSSQELWRSLGQTAPPPAEIPIPKWKLPVAIGSSLMAIAAVGGMSYVNMNPALLKAVPLAAQLTTVQVPVSGPPGEVMLGPDLAMGEFSELNLSNINGITLPGTEAPKAAVLNAPAAAPTAPAVATNSAIVPTLVPSPQAATITPNVPTAPAIRLSDGLIRNLLPPNIQQLATPSASNAPSTPATSLKPYTANQLYYQPSAATVAPSRYAVFTKYVNPLGLSKLQSLAPEATVQGDRVYLGSFAQQSEAAAAVQRMQDQGIKAWLVRPTAKSAQ
jgi:hypothetical protein